MKYDRRSWVTFVPPIISRSIGPDPMFYRVYRGEQFMGSVNSRPAFGLWDAVNLDLPNIKTGFESREDAMDWLDRQESEESR